MLRSSLPGARSSTGQSIGLRSSGPLSRRTPSDHAPHDRQAAVDAAIAREARALAALLGEGNSAADFTRRANAFAGGLQ